MSICALLTLQSPSHAVRAQDTVSRHAEIHAACAMLPSVRGELTGVTNMLLMAAFLSMHRAMAQRVMQIALAQC